MRAAAAFLLASTTLMACDSSEEGQNPLHEADAGAHADAAPPPPIDAGPFVPAPHPPFPQLVKGNGPVLTAPKVVGVFFADYTHTDQVVAMLNGLPTVHTHGGDTFWSASVAEYGVGPLVVLPAIKLAENAPTTFLHNPATWLQGKLASDPAFAAVDTSSIVAIFYPATTPLFGSCAGGGSGYGGFHDSVSSARGQVPYAVVAECSTFGPITNALDMITVAGSHEVIEAVTDPHPTSNPAYATLDATGWSMHVLLQGNEENGDMCTINNGFVRPPTPYGFLIQRGWSNRAAQIGGVDPCSPDVRPDQPFVGAFPVMPDTVTVFGVAGSGPGVKINVGASRTLEVDCFSFERTVPFTVVAREAGAPNPPNLTFTWDRTTCVNGDKLHLTVTVQSAGGLAGHQDFVVRAKLPNVSDTQSPSWAGIVTQ